MTFDASRCQPLKNTQRRLCFIVIFVPRLLFSCNFRLLCPFLSATLPAPLPLLLLLPLSPSFFPRWSVSAVPMQVGLHSLLCCLICTAHSCSFIIVPVAAKALFFGQTMGGVVTESTVVMSHLPPRAISLSCPPSHPTRCPPFNSTLILLQERKTWELSIHPEPPRPQLYTYY